MTIEPWQVALLVALAVSLAVAITLRKMHNDPTSTFDLRDLIMENGRVSKSAFVMMVSFAAMTWAFIFCVLKDQHVEVLFGLYATACFSPILVRLAKANGSAQQPEAQALTVTTTAKVEPQK